MPKRPWYETYFDERYLRQYTPWLTSELSERQVDLIIDRLELEPGAKILDLACGQGRHAIRLAQLGYDVTGLDLSEVLLERAKVDAETAEVNVRWVRADMREIPFGAEFDAVINIFTAFGYLEDDAQDLDVLRSVARCLVPGGALLLETIHRDSLLGRFNPNMFEHNPEERRYILHKNRLDLVRSVMEDRVVVIEDGQVLEERFTSVRLYTIPELTRMLEEAGLEFETAWGGLSGDELTLESRRLALLARRPT